MPNAFEAARRLASAGVDRLDRAYGPLDTPGPDFAVSPFQPGTVTAAAGVVKALTAIGAARRLQANADLKRQQEAIGQQKDAAELARIQAQTEYYNRRGTGAPASTRMRVNPTEPWIKHLGTYDPKDGTAEIKDIQIAQRTWGGLRAGAAGKAGAQFKASTAAIAGKEKALERTLQAQADQEAANTYNTLMKYKDALRDPAQAETAARRLGIVYDGADMVGTLRDAEDAIQRKVEERRLFHYNYLRRGAQRQFDKLDAMRDGLIDPSWAGGGGGDEVVSQINSIMQGPDDDEE